ncbi:hypothetical protein HDG34_003185 [Paraburkholderia sp. HC6.4b]|nr:hypothetical protein [Paraburkholderia sp. HC6.4b]MBB5450972.1 hypothetical protein [Paraburkholderia sp. Kb1A]
MLFAREDSGAPFLRDNETALFPQGTYPHRSKIRPVSGGSLLN